MDGVVQRDQGIWDSTSIEVMDETRNQCQNEGYNLNALGKSRPHWDAIERIVENATLKRELELARAKMAGSTAKTNRAREVGWSLRSAPLPLVNPGGSSRPCISGVPSARAAVTLPESRRAFRRFAAILPARH